jgi:hypothetical protein
MLPVQMNILVLATAKLVCSKRPYELCCVAFSATTFACVYCNHLLAHSTNCSPLAAREAAELEDSQVGFDGFDSKSVRLQRTYPLSAVVGQVLAPLIGRLPRAQ